MKENKGEQIFSADLGWVPRQAILNLSTDSLEDHVGKCKLVGVRNR